MFVRIKNVLVIAALSSSLAACAASGGMPGMKMDHAMCKDMMTKKDCSCCKMMQGQEEMRTSGMMGGKQMMCKPQQEAGKVPVKEASPEASFNPDNAKQKAHHPDKAE